MWKFNATAKNIDFGQPAQSELADLGRNIFARNPFQNKPFLLHARSTSLLKTLWEKTKLLVTSNFSFSHSVLYPFRDFSTILIKFEIVVREIFHL